MVRGYFAYLLLGHILGDFYLQTQVVSDRKEKSLKWVILHGAAYLGAYVIAALPIFSIEVALVGMVASIAHFSVDMIKYGSSLKISNGRNTNILERNIFFADQTLHAVSLMIIAYAATLYCTPITSPGLITGFLEVVGMTGEAASSWIIAVLLIHKPVNIAIQKLLMVYKPISSNVTRINDNNAGRFIGTVERLIMLILISNGQYSAIGLVLTAKSIARYDKIAKEPEFAEYYLLGTLLSTLCVIIASTILR